MKRALFFFASLLLWIGAAAAQQVPGTYFGVATSQPLAGDSHYPTALDTIARINWDTCDTTRTCLPFPSSSVNPCAAANGYTVWIGIETSRGVYDWTSMDAEFAEFEARGIRPVVVLGGKTPAWASASPNACGAPPTDNDMYFEWVQAFATRYKGRVYAYEPWNEVDSSAFYNGTVSQLVTLVNGATAIIRATDPSAKITTPSLTTYAAPAYFDAYLTAGGSTDFDIVNIHAYPWNTTSITAPTYNPGYMVEMITRYKQVLTAHSISTSKPFFVGEVANSASVATANPAFMAISEIVALPYGAEAVTWYTFDQPAGIGNLQGTNQGNNAAGSAYRAWSSRLLNSTWTASPARQEGSNGVTATISGGTPATGTSSVCSAGTAGTLPTGWTLFAPDSAAGVSTHYLGTGTSNGVTYARFRICGTPSASTGASNISFGSTAGVQNSCQTAKLNVALSSGTAWANGYTNVTTYQQVNVFTAGFAYLQTIGISRFQAFSTLGADQQRYTSQTQCVTSGTAANVVPVLQFNYTNGSAFDLTVDIASPWIDSGTRWLGTLTKSNGESAIVAWDDAGQTTPVNYTSAAQYAYYRDVNSSLIYTISANTVPLTTSPVIIEQGIQPVRFN